MLHFTGTSLDTQWWVQETYLNKIVEESVKIRRFNFAASMLEMYKQAVYKQAAKKETEKTKSLRTKLFTWLLILIVIIGYSELLL